MARRLSAQERRQQLIRVGRKVFATNGYEGTTVEEIARRAKVSKPIVYEHFGGKEGLYAVVVDRSMADLTERIIGAIQRGTPRQRVEGAALAFMTWVKDEPDGFMVLLRDKPNSRAGGMAGLMHDLADHVSDVFAEQFVASGYDRRMAGLYARMLVGMVAFAGEWWLEPRRAPPPEVVASHVSAMAYMGLRHLPSEPAPIDRSTLLPPPEEESP